MSKIIIQRLTSSLRRLLSSSLMLLSFILLVLLYSLKLFLDKLAQRDWFAQAPLQALAGKCTRFYERSANHLAQVENSHLNRAYLIELAFQNMRAKKTRTVVTIGGMAIGIAFIVFLVSIGYGLQHMVTSRVARLEELQQAEVLPGLSEELALTDQTLARLNNMPEIAEALPVIGIVGRISFQDSVSDLAIYGVTSPYLNNSAIKPTHGRIFDSQEVVHRSNNSDLIVDLEPATAGEEASASAELTTDRQAVSFSIDEGAWLRVRDRASTQGRVLGYTRRHNEQQNGWQVTGDSYQTGTESANLWIEADFPLWQTTDTDGEYVPLLDATGQQVNATGYSAQLSMTIALKVLGESTSASAATLAATAGSGTLPVVNLSSPETTPVNDNTKVVSLPRNSLREAVVNKAVLTILGISEQEALNQTISLTFIAVGDLIDGEIERIESTPTDYKIVGVTPDEGTPVIFVPFVELRSLGIDRISQIKIIVHDQHQLGQVRASVESMGYGTVSVVDTVAQINSLFASFRLVLAVIGMVALAVATLGMFNTLTVSLLERTREVGLMKAMGMKSVEVRELFLTESMIMGFYGGLLGLLLGFLAGKLLSLVLSSIALARGIGALDIAVIPPVFVVVVILLSLLVGILTGYYPAKRATKISALNALRYE